MNKVCPKCDQPHEKPGKFCCRSCANSRSWSEADKKKRSLIALNSDNVKLANSNIEKRLLLSLKATEQHRITKEDTIKRDPFPEGAREKSIATNKLKAVQRRLNSNFDSKKEYRFLCQFNFKLADFPEEFDFDLIKTFGWYKAPNRGNNPNGISRDHKFSVSDGWKYSIDPEKIRHPANCQLMCHTQNWEKRSESSITVEELENLIDLWNKKYNT